MNIPGANQPGQLAEWVVELKAAGAEAVKAVLDDLTHRTQSLPDKKTIRLAAAMDIVPAAITPAITGAVSAFVGTMVAKAVTTATSQAGSAVLTRPFNVDLTGVKTATGGGGVPQLPGPGVGALGPSQRFPIAPSSPTGQSGFVPKALPVLPVWIQGPFPLPVRVVDGLMGTTGGGPGPGAGRSPTAPDNRGRSAVGFGFAAVSGGITGAITAGLRGTAEGEQIALHFQLISREIAATFLPAIHLAIDGLQKTLGWFRGLSGEQQLAISRTAAVSAAVLGLGVALPKVTSGLSAVAAGLKFLTVGNPFVAVVGGLVALLSRTEEGRHTLTQFGQSAMKAGAAVADALGSVLETIMPAIDAVSSFLSTTEGKWVALGLVIVAAVPKIVAALRAVAAGFAMLHAAAGGPLAAIVTVLGVAVAGVAVAAAFHGAGERAGKAFMEGLIKEVGSKRMTLEAAHEKIRQDVIMKWALHPELGPGEREKGRVGTDRQFMEAEIAGAQHRFDALFQRFREKGGRHELQPNKTGFEALTDTWKRLQLAANKMEMTEKPANAELQAKQRDQLQRSNDLLAIIARGIAGLNLIVD